METVIENQNYVQSKYRNKDTSPRRSIYSTTPVPKAQGSFQKREQNEHCCGIMLLHTVKNSPLYWLNKTPIGQQTGRKSRLGKQIMRILGKGKVEIQSPARCRGSRMRIPHLEKVPSHVAKHREK